MYVKEKTGMKNIKFDSFSKLSGNKATAHENRKTVKNEGTNSDS
jgi:hypothetical protein